MPTPTSKQPKKASHISFRRNGRSTDLHIEGSAALLVFGVIALAYIFYLLLR